MRISGVSVTVSPGSGIAVEFSGNPPITYVQSGPASVNSVAVSIAQALTTTPTVLLAQASTLANPAYGLIGMNPAINLLSAGSTAIQYTAVTSGNLRPVNAGATPCPLPAPLGIGSGPCISGEMDIGDGVALRNSAHDIDFEDLRIQSILGVSVHMWPAGANAFKIVDNVLGEGHGKTPVTALELDPDPAFSGNPSDYDIEGNDLVGATPIVAPLPTPTFQTTGAAPVMRNNRGALGIIVGPVMTGSISTLTIQNAGPLDCTYYFSAWSGSFSATITLPGGASQTLPYEPASASIPVGAFLVASVTSGMGSLSYVGFCQP